MFASSYLIRGTVRHLFRSRDAMKKSPRHLDASNRESLRTSALGATWREPHQTQSRPTEDAMLTLTKHGQAESWASNLQ